MYSFDCTSSPRAKQVDALARVVNKRMGSFILARGSILFDKFMCDFIYVDIYFDAQSHKRFIEYLYIDVKRSFRCRQCDKMYLGNCTYRSKSHIFGI